MNKHKASVIAVYLALALFSATGAYSWVRLRGYLMAGICTVCTVIYLANAKDTYYREY